MQEHKPKPKPWSQMSGPGSGFLVLDSSSWMLALDIGSEVFGLEFSTFGSRSLILSSSPFIGYYKAWQNFYNVWQFKTVTESYYKVWQVLQSAGGITRYNRKLLQSVTVITKCDKKLLQSVTDNLRAKAETWTWLKKKGVSLLFTHRKSKC